MEQSDKWNLGFMKTWHQTVLTNDTFKDLKVAGRYMGDHFAMVVHQNPYKSKVCLLQEWFSGLYGKLSKKKL